MRALDASEIVTLWERLRQASPTARAVGVLAAAMELDASDVGRMPVWRRDAGLLSVRRASYGKLAACFVACPRCGVELEFDVDLSALAVSAQHDGNGIFRLEHEGFCLAFRLPTSDDLHAIEGATSAGEAVDLLLDRCVQRAEQHGDHIEPRRLPVDVRDALAAELTRLDPQADISFAVPCDACGHQWSSPFDISAYLWREIEVDARRLLGEVDALARAYGWSEAQILALSRARRRAYLELVSGS